LPFFFVLSMHESTCVLNKFKCKFSSPHIYTQITSYTTLLFQFVIPPVTAGLYYCILPHDHLLFARSLFLFLIINKYTQTHIKFTHSLPRCVNKAIEKRLVIEFQCITLTHFSSHKTSFIVKIFIMWMKL